MPLLRRVIKVGNNSKAVILPYEWPEAYRREHGKELVEVGMEVDNIITISPFPFNEPAKEKKVE